MRRVSVPLLAHSVPRRVVLAAVALLIGVPQAIRAIEVETTTDSAPAGPPDPLAAGWEGAPVCERLHEDEALRVLRCTFPPGVGHERHFHPRHFGYALSGGRVRLTDERGTREIEIATGSSFASDGIAWHEVLNIGETTIAYLIVEPCDGDPVAGPPVAEDEIAR